MRIIWQIAARRKMIQILTFISAESPTAAKKYTDEIFERTNAILQFPEIGTIYSTSNHTVVRRVIIDKTKSILYRIENNNVFILNIMDNRQDWKL
jgi:plasmid stabilization system protein ParE